MKKFEEVLASAERTDAEKLVIKWRLNQFGSFFTALFEAMRIADPINLKKLAQGFPEEVAAFELWRDDVEFTSESNK